VCALAWAVATPVQGDRFDPILLLGFDRRGLAVRNDLARGGRYGCNMRAVDRADVARSSVVLAVGAALALISLLVLKRAWHDLDCGDAHTVILDAVITTTALLSGVSVVVASFAIVLRTKVRRSVAMVILGGTILVLVFLPSSSFRVDLATYNCGVEVV
jgi:hypothetical protein